MKVDLLWYALPVSLLVGSVLSWLVYRRNLHKKQARLLIFLRALGWTMLVFLLFKPSFSLLTNREVKSKIRLFRDASGSANPYSRIEALAIKQQIERDFNNEVDVELTAFGQGLISESWDSLWTESTNFIAKETRFDEVNESIINLKNESSVQAAIVISDGILNSGSSPVNRNSKVNKPVLFIGVGDSTKYPDASVEQLISNNEVFLGNTTQIETLIRYQHISSNKFVVELLENGQVIQQKSITMNSSKGKSLSGKSFLTFDYTGKVKGAQSLQVRCSLPEDRNPNNNINSKSIEVVDRRKKILIINGKPHPDIKALVESLGSTIQNEVLVISETEVQVQTQSLKDAEMVVLHGVENVGTFEEVQRQKLPHWVFANTPTSLVFANKNSGVTVGNISRITTFQTVGVMLNEDFDLFRWSPSNSNKIQNLWGGISATLVKLNPNSNSTVQLKQIWNSTVTDFPLSSVNANSEVPSFWFWGEGIWKSRLNEFRKNQTTEQFDAWVNTSMQWLGSNPSDKKGLKIITSSDQAQLGELYRFKVLKYDQAGNKSDKDNLTANVVYQNGKTQAVPLLKVNQEYLGSFIPEETGSVSLKIGNSSTTYNTMGKSLKANALKDNKTKEPTTSGISQKHRKSNEYTSAEKVIFVSSVSLEQRTKQADFELLRKWANSRNGGFIPSPSEDSQIDENESLVKKDFLLNNKRTLVTAAIKNWIEKNKLNQIRIIEETRTVGVREWIVYLLIVCGVFGAEWILRKRWGLES
jgi:hypothetical protein